MFLSNRDLVCCTSSGETSLTRKKNDIDAILAAKLSNSGPIAPPIRLPERVLACAQTQPSGELAIKRFPKLPIPIWSLQVTLIFR